MFASTALLLLTLVQTPLPRPVASLTVQTGKVRLVRKVGDPAIVTKGARLREGDKITIVEKGRMTVRVDKTLSTWRLPESGAFLAHAGGLQGLEGAKAQLLHQQQKVAGKRGQPTGTVADKIRSGAGWIAPFGCVEQGPVNVTWSKAPGVTQVRVAVLDSGNKVVWPKQPDKNLGPISLALLPDGALKPGEWRKIRVTLISPGGTEVLTSWVRALTTAEQNALRQAEAEARKALVEDPGALGLALGDLWAEYRMGSKLVGAVEMTYGLAASSDAQWQLGTWYEKAGFKSEALAAFKAAWKAGERDPALKESIEKLGGKAEIEEWEKLAAERDRLMKEGKYQEALPVAQRVVELLRKEKPGSEELGKALTSVGDLLERLGQLDEADKVLEEALAILESVTSPSSLSIGEVYFLQSWIARGTGDLSLASERASAALAVYGSHAAASLKVADCQTLLGSLAQEQGKYEDAKTRFEAALTVFEKVDPNSKDTAKVHGQLGVLAAEQGDLAEAVRRLTLALAIFDRHPDSILERARTLRNLGVVTHRLRDFRKARQHASHALEIIRRVLPGSVEEAECLTNLALIASENGDKEEAGHFIEAALAIYSRENPNSLEVADCLHDLGLLLFERDALALAQRTFERADAIYEQVASPKRAISQLSLGNVARKRGELEVAQLRFKMSLALSPADTKEYANAHGSLAAVAFERGDLDEAQHRYEAALAIQERLDPGSLKVAKSLNGLGAVAYDRGDLAEAHRRFEAALAIVEKLAPGSLHVAGVLHNLSFIAWRQGELMEAQAQNEAALRIREWLAPSSLSVLSSLRNLTAISRLRQDLLETTKWQTRELAVATELAWEFGLASDLGAFGTLATTTLTRTGWLQDPAPFYPWLPTLRGAGLTLQIRAKISELAAETDENVRKARSAVQIATKQETDWVTNPRPAGMDEKAWNDTLLELRSQRQSAELKLATLLKEKDPRLGEALKVETAQVQESLPEGHLLVEYLRVSTWDDKTKKSGPDAYAAYLVPKKGEVKYVRLGNAEVIDKLVQDWQTQMAYATDPNADEPTLKDTEKKLKEIGRQLHDKLIKPLGKLPEEVLIAPDSRLHALPFGALVDGRGKFLLETKVLSTLGSGRDLVSRPIAGEPGPPAVIALNTFDYDPNNHGKEQFPKENRESPVAGKASRGPRGTTWTELRAETEGAFVADRLGVQGVFGAAATEEHFLSLKSPRVLHVATHGFYNSTPVEQRPLDDFKLSAFDRLGYVDQPMLRCGLVLAGANDGDQLTKANRANGLVTALDVSLMDLRGTELVVLSACETGLGDVRGSEGVFGLQRAFRFAGAQTLVMSLFKVPDTPTQELMAAFYGAWKPGDPSGTKLKALRDAQLAMLKDPNKRHPRNWSAFVLMGIR